MAADEDDGLLLLVPVIEGERGECGEYGERGERGDPDVLLGEGGLTGGGDGGGDDFLERGIFLADCVERWTVCCKDCVVGI
jgi:hypothetical protein